MMLADTGHIRLSDGSVIRLDVECGHYVGTYYRPDMTTRSRVAGSLHHVQAVIETWRDIAGSVNMFRV